ncbi:unnamed protein product [Microthlaspi erraticum]|uniref:F-box domain-containing protein n=1 Tax=Microthlaspi erraticum TaxID=1685480 RepID=A0A6D2JRZ7_9BRAS|nr:unnamed protein product [Microthlaspi erraticum]
MKLEDDVPESIMVMILARLPIRSISRFKSVCSQWKQLFESSYFRNLYGSLNQKNLSSPWSIMNLDSRSREYLLEHFSERWGLTETLGTSLLRLLDHMKEGTRAVDMSDGLVLLAEKDKEDSFLVANPVLQEWIKIPSPPPVEARCLCEAALVTHMSNDGDLLGYKVVWFEKRFSINSFNFQVHSSETGNWTYREVLHDRGNLHYHLNSKPINLNGCVHWLFSLSGVIISYDDFYARTSQEAQQLGRVVDLPDWSNYSKYTCTVSCGSLMLIQKTGREMRVWRLEKQETNWELVWNVTTYGQDLFGNGSITCRMPMMMHPFDSEVVFLLGRGSDGGHSYLVSGNMRTEKFQLHKELNHVPLSDVHFCQFVLPQRLGSIPCPPGCSLVTASATQV